MKWKRKEKKLYRKVKIDWSNRSDEYYGKYDASGQHPGPFAKFLEKRIHNVRYTTTKWCVKNA